MLCVFVHHILCFLFCFCFVFLRVVFLFCFSSFCVPCVSSFYRLSINLVGSVLLIFLVFLCCPIMYLYILSSVLWCQLRFPNRNDVQFVFTFSCLEESSCLIYVICICLRKVVLLFCLSSSFFLCARCCQFLWIVHFWLPLQYSLAFIQLHWTNIYCYF